jgi:hypothetical protein
MLTFSIIQKLHKFLVAFLKILINLKIPEKFSKNLKILKNAQKSSGIKIFQCCRVAKFSNSFSQHQKKSTKTPKDLKNSPKILNIVIFLKNPAISI